MLFSDRFWIVKAAAALGLFAVLCTRSRSEISGELPEPELSAGVFESVKGKTTYLWSRRVLKTTPEYFEVASYVGPLKVVSRGAPAEGARVSVVGTITAPRTISARSLQVNEGYDWKRPLNYLISIATLAVFLAAIRPRFRFAITDGVFRSRY